MSIQAILFDLDGVIVSTDELHYLAWQKLADDEGIYFDRDINRRLRGVGRMPALDILLERAERSYSEAEKLAFATRKNETYKNLLNRISPDDVLPGVLPLLHALRERGLRLSTASSSRNAPKILEQIGLDNFFDAMVDGNHIERSKPDPQVFLLAAERLQASPDVCLVIEDADAGVEAAAAAKMRVLAVGEACHHPQATLRADDLSEITVDQLLQCGETAQA